MRHRCTKINICNNSQYITKFIFIKNDNSLLWNAYLFKVVTYYSLEQWFTKGSIQFQKIKRYAT